MGMCSWNSDNRLRDGKCHFLYNRLTSKINKDRITLPSPFLRESHESLIGIGSAGASHTMIGEKPQESLAVIRNYLIR